MIATGGGGGGGGSSLVPRGGIWSVSEPASEPEVKLTYTIPGTEITAGPTAAINTPFTRFEVASTEAGSRFECSLDGAPFALCAVPVDLTGLAEGPHRFAVRATNPMDNFDPTPAVRDFAVDSVAPVTTIEAGPEGITPVRRPEFRFRATEAGVTFECGFDGNGFGPCLEPGIEIPGEALGFGPHTFAVRATDAVGNVGPAATRAFEVVDPPPPEPLPADPSRRSPATLKLGRAKLRPKLGTALLPVRVSAAGRVAVPATRRLRPQSKRVRRPGTVRLRIAARGGALRLLRRRGRATVTVRVVYRPAGAERIVRAKRLTLKLKSRPRGR